jgi:hypothetical protein
MSLDLDPVSKARLRKFHADGLLYLVNTSVLHPRGYALTLHVDDATGEPIGLSVTGDGTEPWCFAYDELGNVMQRYHASEQLRELEWKKKNPSVIPAPLPDVDIGPLQLD